MMRVCLSHTNESLIGASVDRQGRGAVGYARSLRRPATRAPAEVSADEIAYSRRERPFLAHAPERGEQTGLQRRVPSVSIAHRFCRNGLRGFGAARDARRHASEEYIEALGHGRVRQDRVA